MRAEGKQRVIGDGIPYIALIVSTSPEQRQRARLVCADMARDCADLADLLWVLGLDQP